jgi:uncharacterized RDD family membrane protein YckC
MDALVRMAVLYVAALVLLATNMFGGVGVALMLIGAFLLEWFYPVAFELSRMGATPGKKIFGLTVLMDTGLPITPAASITRNLLRTADFLPFMYGAGIVSMLLRKDFKRLGDLAAGTCVVYRLERTTRVELGSVAPRPPEIPLDRREQAAIVAFAARLPRLTGERAEELAALAAPVVGGQTGADGDLTQKLLGVAQWLVGKRT